MIFIFFLCYYMKFLAFGKFFLLSAVFVFCCFQVEMPMFLFHLLKEAFAPEDFLHELKLDRQVVSTNPHNVLLPHELPDLLSVTLLHH